MNNEPRHVTHHVLDDYDVVVAIKFDTIPDAEQFRRDPYRINLDRVAGFRFVEWSREVPAG
jgi:hypothetical protein